MIAARVDPDTPSLRSFVRDDNVPYPSLLEHHMRPWRLPSVRWPLLLLQTSIGFTTSNTSDVRRLIAVVQLLAA